jgi:hypothetical protein
VSMWHFNFFFSVTALSIISLQFDAYFWDVELKHTEIYSAVFFSLENHCFLRCDIVSSDRTLPTFQKNLLPSSSEDGYSMFPPNFVNDLPDYVLSHSWRQ